ncbi:MAG: hypothetical protein KKA28_04690 [Planctomycetes bacterium]|nr:hypothetical protein [Planctomycetota bacterium]MCG2682233.1 hypothetical protein [Planctomycetales bacterium]
MNRRTPNEKRATRVGGPSFGFTPLGRQFNCRPNAGELSEGFTPPASAATRRNRPQPSQQAQLSTLRVWLFEWGQRRLHACLHALPIAI